MVFCTFLLFKKGTKIGISSLLDYVSDSWGGQKHVLGVCGSEDKHAPITIPFSYCLPSPMEIQIFPVLWFEKWNSRQTLYSKWIHIPVFPWQTDLCAQLKLHSAVNLPRLPKGYAGRWGRASPSWGEHHQQSVLKADGAELLLSTAILVQDEQQYKACVQPKQSLQRCHLYDIPERIFPEVAKLKELMFQILARKVLLTV